MHPRHLALLIVALYLLTAYCLSAAASPQPPAVNQVTLWRKAEIKKIDMLRLDKLIARYQRTHARYDLVAAAVTGGRPPSIILFALHYREGDNDFNTHPHNGDPLNHRTFHVPRGRLPHTASPASDPPYKWEQSAIDAWFVVDHLQNTDWQSTQSSLDRIESFNGMGYRKRGVPSPYLWAGTNIYTRGKYVADGRFDPLAVDKQLGCVAILKHALPHSQQSTLNYQPLLPAWLTPQVPEKPYPPHP